MEITYHKCKLLYYSFAFCVGAFDCFFISSPRKYSFARDFKCTPTKNLAMSIVMISHYANRRVRKSRRLQYASRIVTCAKNILRIVYLRGGTTCKSHLRGGHNWQCRFFRDVHSIRDRKALRTLTSREPMFCIVSLMIRRIVQCH